MTRNGPMRWDKRWQNFLLLLFLSLSSLQSANRHITTRISQKPQMLTTPLSNLTSNVLTKQH